jgi:hypothetical protein
LTDANARYGPIHFGTLPFCIAPKRGSRAPQGRIEEEQCDRKFCTGIMAVYCTGKQGQLHLFITSKNGLNNLERTCQKMQLHIFFN